MEREFKGVWIPKEIWLNKDLSLIEKVLLVEIDSLDNENHCIASNEYFAEFFGCSERTISRAVTRLKELNYITELPFNGKHRKLSIDKMSTLHRQNDESASTNCLPNNINSKLDNSNPTKVGEQATPTRRHLITSDIPSNTATTHTKKKNLYEKCVEEIDSYTEDKDIQDRLKEYLPIRLARKEIPLNTATFKGMLKRLDRVAGTKEDKLKSIQQSIDRQYPTFYEPHKKKSLGQDTGVFSEYGTVKTGNSGKGVLANVQF